MNLMAADRSEGFDRAEGLDAMAATAGWHGQWQHADTAIAANDDLEPLQRRPGLVIFDDEPA